MASLQKRGESYRVQFFFRGKLHGFSLGKASEAEALAKAGQVDYLLLRLKRQLLSLPIGADIVSFVEHDGKPPAPSQAQGSGTAPRSVTLSQLVERYLTTHSNGTLEANTLATCRLHFNHMSRALGGGLVLNELSLPALQDYVTARSKAGIAVATARKELCTFRAA